VIVLDASALIALYKEENGYRRVLAEISSSAISTVNLAEAMTKFVEDDGTADRIPHELGLFGCEMIPVSVGHALAAANLRPSTRRFGLSLGDRLCLALGIERQCSILTADRNWARLDIGVPIVLIR
jgi:ribonuclease VapC